MKDKALRNLLCELNIICESDNKIGKPYLESTLKESEEVEKKDAKDIYIKVPTGKFNKYSRESDGLRPSKEKIEVVDKEGKYKFGAYGVCLETYAPHAIEMTLQEVIDMLFENLGLVIDYEPSKEEKIGNKLKKVVKKKKRK